MTTDSTQTLTPLMKQYFQLKSEADGAILFFRMGDFYELFGDDAVEAAPLLGVTLTSRNKNAENPMPMAGLPYHSAQNYIHKLLTAGKKVAIAEQILPEGMTTDQIKGIVDRKIIRTFTPAVHFDLEVPGQDARETAQARYLAIAVPQQGRNLFSLVFLDPTTGETRLASNLSEDELTSCPLLPRIRHYLHAFSATPTSLLKTLQGINSVLIEEIPSNRVADTEVTSFLQKQYGRLVLNPLLENQASQKAIALLIHYTLRSQQLDRLPHLQEPQGIQELDQLRVGPNTHQHLDSNDLFALINATSTSMGARALKQKLMAPHRTINAVHEEQAAIQDLAKSAYTVKIQETLKSVYDLSRILGRIGIRLANPRDTLALGKSVRAIFDLLEAFSSLKAEKNIDLARAIQDTRSMLEPFADRIVRFQKPDAPIHTRDGGIFETGLDPELDRLIQLSQNGERFIIELETREREATGIGSLKVKYNRVFGYFIEVSSANISKVPEHYQRKQTMVGGERFFTEELKRFEEEVLTASQKQRALEQQIFQDWIDEGVRLMEPLKVIASAVGEIDALVSLSMLAHRTGWNFPVIDESFDLEVHGSRHPVVEASSGGKFVPNDFSMNAETARTLIITGPNMGGKSTIMRQIAQLILLGQMGAPVPARSARWGIFESVYTRIGAHDAIAQGQSTFMVEMVELAHILHHANERSFVVLDEVGRGTSTFDGMSVATAALEYLHTKTKARIVFATHYHELTGLEDRFAGIRNFHLSVSDRNGQLTFLYEMKPGKSSKSFGIQVAQMAGIPKIVIDTAWNRLKEFEAESPRSKDLSLLKARPSPLKNLTENYSEPLTESTPQKRSASDQLSLF